ncbi:hypothetical protein D3C77_562510 [compost metagenome]
MKAVPALLGNAAQSLLLAQRRFVEQGSDLRANIGDQLDLGLGLSIAENAAGDVGIHVEALMFVGGLFEHAHFGDPVQGKLAQVAVAIHRGQHVAHRMTRHQASRVQAKMLEFTFAAAVVDHFQLLALQQAGRYLGPGVRADLRRE